MASIWRKFMCSIGRHKSLDEINKFGAASQAGCPHCGRMFAIHDGLRAVVPWDNEFADMYTRFGHNVDQNQRKWQSYRKAKGFTP